MSREEGYVRTTYTDPTVLNGSVSLAMNHCYQLAVIAVRTYVCKTGHLVSLGNITIPIDYIVWA